MGCSHEEPPAHAGGGPVDRGIPSPDGPTLADSSPAPSVNVQGGDGWRNTNKFDVAIAKPNENANESPITSVYYRLCPEATSSNDCTTPWTGPKSIDANATTVTLAGLQKFGSV